MVERPSVRLSVRLSHRSTAAAACGGFSAERPAGRRYRPVAGNGLYYIILYLFIYLFPYGPMSVCLSV